MKKEYFHQSLSVMRDNFYSSLSLSYFSSVLFFCVACIIFPFGFHIEEIGGHAYKLPMHAQVGYSYYLFCGAVTLLTAAVILCNMDVIRENFHHRLQR